MKSGGCGELGAAGGKCGCGGGSSSGSCRQGGQGRRGLEKICSGAGFGLGTVAAGPQGEAANLPTRPHASGWLDETCIMTLLYPEHWTGSLATQALHQLCALGHLSSLCLPSLLPLA